MEYLVLIAIIAGIIGGVIYNECEIKHPAALVQKYLDGSRYA